jgi:membrane protein YdbS with pleckstrin-like domain
MDTLEVSKTFKQVDPIWKRLRVNRIWVLFFTAFCVVYLCYYAWASYTGLNKNAGITWVYLFYIFVWLSKAAGHFKQEEYWKRIGQRRLEAMQGAQPFLATNQPSHNENTLASPIMLRLRWHRGIVVAVGVLALIPILLLIIFGTLDLYQHSHTLDFLEPLTFFIAIFLLAGVLIYFTYLRNMPSMIEINEEGIRTRYMRQERFLRWDEARVFATYDAQGTKKSAFASTYELSNEHTVVRWSQQMLTNPFLFLALESNIDKKEDWNWQIGRINSIVASRTGLPLLDLSDGKQKRSAISERRTGFSNRPYNPVTSDVTAPTPIRIAQDDLLANRVQLNGETGKLLWVLGGIAIIALVVGLFGKFENNGRHTTSFPPVDVVNPLLWIGGLFLILTVFLFLILFYSGRYWNRIRRKRREVLQQPEHFLVPGQPAAHGEQPLPATMHIRIRKRFFLPMLFIESFVVSLILTGVFFQWPHKSLLVTLIITLCFASLMSLFMLPIVSRSSGYRIEVRSDGIATRYGTVDSYVSWDDARLFARYGALRLIKRSSHIQLYELASERTVVRWQWSHSRLGTMMLTPQMSREEFDRWLEQLQGYIVARTGLSLMDLDSYESNPR